MIKAVVFDCFGVLSSDGWLPFRDSYFGNKPLLLERAKALNKSVDGGLTSYVDFIKQVALMAKIPVSDARQQIENNVSNTKLFNYILSDLKPDYKIGMLSNAAENWLSELFTPEQVAMFDAVGLSYEIGAIKPAPITYHTIAERLGAKTSECLLVDDQEKFCLGAEVVGMQALLYTSFEQFKKDIPSVLAHN